METMKRQPQRLPLDTIYNILPKEEKYNNRALSYRDGMGVAVGINGFFFNYLGDLKTPYLLEDYRMGMVMRGELRGVINLREYTMHEGSIVFVTPGTIVEPLGASDDFLMDGMGMPADKFLLAHGGKLPELFCGQMKDGRRMLPHENRMMLDKMFCLLHDLMEHEDTAEGVTYSMVTTISHYVDQLFNDSTAIPAASHSTDLFNRFLRLVNQYGQREHQLGFYADKLCITSRYLGTLVMSVSGVSAKEWIDRAIISAAKVQLRHSDRQTTL